MTTTTLETTIPTTTTAPFPGGVRGTPNVLLRLEGAALLALATLAYAQLGAGFGVYAALFLVPDLAFIGYLAGPRIGAIAYNATHALVGPTALFALSYAMPALLPYALIWAAHVGFDRMLGYGLKYDTAFGHTHLGEVGRRA
jgi:hypothetical protein